MTKEKFVNSDREYYTCKICGETIEKKYMPYRFATVNGISSNCKACSYLQRHSNETLIDGWTFDEYRSVIHQIFNCGKEFINDIFIENKSLREICEFISALKLNGVKIKIKVKCDYCNEEVICYPTKYLNNDCIFCNSEHYWKYKKEHALTKELSPSYKRIKTSCTNCNKEIHVIPAHYNTTNRFGDNHNFCSKECYWEYRSKYYVGEKSVGANREYTEEQREQARIISLKNSRKSSRFDSKIQLKINNLLDDLKINYEREYIMGYYAVDNYLTDYNLVIEVMGDYWHGNPIMFNSKKYLLNKIQDRGIHTDKTKSSYIRNHYGINILYLWETDINNNLEKCKNLILSYIDNLGVLSNYHSFNYTYYQNNLSINNTLIIPYQNMPKKEYLDAIKVV